MNVPFETWYALGGAVIALVVGAAHRRGRRLPFLEFLLDALDGPPRPAAKEPITLEQVMDELRKRVPIKEDAR